MNRNANADRWPITPRCEATQVPRDQDPARRLAALNGWQGPTPAAARPWEIVEDHRYRRHLTCAAMRVWVPGAVGVIQEPT